MAFARHYSAAAGATVLVALLLVACGSGSGPKAGLSAPASAKSASAITVTIKNFAYFPANVTVIPGATVTVRNEDDVIHTLTADNQAFNTGDVSQNQPATFTAPTQPGKYPYHCLLHPYMTGVLIVY